MPKRTLPPGWPDPYTLLRDPNWEDNYPKLFLRGVYAIMKRAPGDIEAKYKAGFNICLHKLTIVSQPPSLWKDQVVKGVLNLRTLTPHGKMREKEVLGLVELSAKSRRKYGKKVTRADMKKNTQVKMKELRRMLDMVRGTTAEDGMSPATAAAAVIGGAAVAAAAAAAAAAAGGG